MNSDIKPIFPIAPTFISKLNINDLIDKFHPDENLEDDLNNAGMYHEDILQGALANISNDEKIQAPAALFQFIPNFLKDIKVEGKDSHINDNVDPFFNSITESKYILRLDSEKYFRIKDCCAAFRECVGKNLICNTKNIPKKERNISLCHEIDSRVAFFAFPGITQRNVVTILTPILADYNAISGTPPVELFEYVNSDISLKQYYIKYKCPYSLFHEIITPIFHEDKVIGCFMIGQIPYKELAEDKAGMFQRDFIERQNIGTVKFTQDDLKNICGKIRISDIKSNTPIEESVGALLKHTSKFEERFNKRVDLMRHAYIASKFSEITNKFLEDSQKIKIDPDGDLYSLNPLADIIKDALKSVIWHFKNQGGFIRVFAVKDFFLKPKILEFITANDECEFNTQNFTFDLEKISDIVNLRRTISNNEEDIQKGSIDSIDVSTIKNGLISNDGKEYFDPEKDILRYFPTFSPKISFVFWKRYTNGLMKSENGNIQKKLYTDAMFDLYTYISASYSTLWGSLLEKELEKTVRIAGHQSDQITPNIVEVLNKNFKDFQTIAELNRTGLLNKKLRDLKNSFALLNLFQTRPAMLFREINKENKIEIDLTGTLYKIKELFEKEATVKMNQIVLNLPSSGSSKILVNEASFEHILFNLIDNAIKYSYRGTVIEISYKENNKNVLIHVKSYGNLIAKGEDIYKLYKRGSDTHKVGEGIGMYIVKKIIIAHGGEIKHESNFISKFNIGCIAKVNSHNLEKMVEEVEAIDKDKSYFILIESRRIRSLNSQNSIIASNEYGNFLYEPGSITFAFEYNSPTYCNDFYFTIPKTI